MKMLKSVLSTLCLLATVLCGLLSLGLAQEVPPARPLPLPDARLNGPTESAQGNLWMGWSADHRLGYVQGWLEGSYWGYFNACTEAQLEAQSIPDIQDKCLVHIPSAHLTSEAYADTVTEFYSKYPQDRALPIRRLLRRLLEPDMTVDGVHKWLDELIESTQRSERK
jgi:hypothetical protein